MIVGVLKEIKPNEYRVAATPAAVGQIVSRGHQVLVQALAGSEAIIKRSEVVVAMPMGQQNHLWQFFLP